MDKWDRSGCVESVCTCHDETITPAYKCSNCGCQPVQPFRQHNYLPLTPRVRPSIVHHSPTGLSIRARLIIVEWFRKCPVVWKGITRADEQALEDCIVREFQVLLRDREKVTR